MPRKKTVYLVDGSGQFHRAFHAIRGLATSRGLPTNATYGFTTMLRKLLQEEQPDYCAAVFDTGGPTVRHAAYADYKSSRPETPPEIRQQIPYIKKVCAVLGIPVM